MHNVEIGEERGQKYCPLSEKAEEDQKEAKEVVVLSNALTAGLWFLGTRQRNPLAESRL